jgi:NAD(P) transhydrogenase subunit alpha
MKISCIKEKKEYENRVAITPGGAEKLIQMGFEVVLEKGAGEGASFPDELYEAKGVKIAKTAKAALEDAHIIFKVAPPEKEELKNFPKDAILVGMLSPYTQTDLLKEYAAKKISSFSLELLPRITRAQSMDVLSSQSNLAGYRAVLETAFAFSRGFPMMMTAAGTIPPAKVLILGAGVAGLQAIATAKRLGAIVFAFDVRTVAKEQVESLGATFIAVPHEEEGNAASVYAKEMSEDYKRKQSELIAETLKKVDIAITTALIPGKKAPILITAEMIKDMKPGSIILDLAIEMGGNVVGSEMGKTVDIGGVKIIGKPNLPSSIAQDASTLYGKNLITFLGGIYDSKTQGINIDLQDEIIKATLLTHEGKIVHPNFNGEKE